MEYLIYMILIYFISSILIKPLTRFNYQPKLIEPSPLEPAYDEIERAYTNYQLAKNSLHPSNQRHAIYFLRNEVLDLHQFLSQKRPSPSVINQSAKSKALDYYLFGHIEPSMEMLTQEEIGSLPPLLSTMYQQQVKLNRLILGQDWQGLKTFLQQIPWEDKLLLNFNHFNLKYAYLSQIDFSGLSMNHVDFSHSQLDGANFTWSYINNTTFDHSDIRNILLNSIIFRIDSLSFVGAHISPATFKALRQQQLSDFSHVNFYGDFNDTDFSNLILINARFIDGSYENTKFNETLIARARFLKPLPKADFSRAIFTAGNDAMNIIERKIADKLSSNKQKNQEFALKVANQYHDIIQTMQTQGYNPKQFPITSWLRYAELYEHEVIKKILNQFMFSKKVTQKAVSLANNASGFFHQAQNKVSNFIQNKLKGKKHTKSNQSQSSKPQEESTTHSSKS
jgi:uncharacterized protein YjbI with pentapeptide repeats